MWGNRVRAEPIRGEIPRYNLVDTAWPGQINPEWSRIHGLTGDPDKAWMRGIKWRPIGCVEAHAWEPNCARWPKEDKSDPPTPQDLYEVDAFVIETAYGCTLPAATAVDEYRDIALYQLTQATTKALEYQFWANALGGLYQSLDSTGQEFTGLSSAATIISGSSGFDRQIGLALAGQGLANCGAGERGVIHAPPWIVHLWIGDGLIKDEDGYLVTPRGDRVVMGSGYPGTGPGGVGVSGTQSWIWATGPVEVYLEPIAPDGINGPAGGGIVGDATITPSFDRTENRVEFRAERIALTRFDPCCRIAVLIDAASNSGGGG